MCTVARSHDRGDNQATQGRFGDAPGGCSEIFVPPVTAAFAAGTNSPVAVSSQRS